MENILQLLGPLVIILLISILSNARRRKAQQQKVERGTDERAMSESDTAPPPFMEDFPFETQQEQMVLRRDEEEVMPVAEEPARPEPEKPDPVVENTSVTSASSACRLSHQNTVCPGNITAGFVTTNVSSGHHSLRDPRSSQSTWFPSETILMVVSYQLSVVSYKRVFLFGCFLC